MKETELLLMLNFIHSNEIDSLGADLLFRKRRLVDLGGISLLQSFQYSMATVDSMRSHERSTARRPERTVRNVGG
jgi:hypothetical protein